MGTWDIKERPGGHILVRNGEMGGNPDNAHMQFWRRAVAAEEAIRLFMKDNNRYTQSTEDTIKGGSEHEMFEMMAATFFPVVPDQQASDTEYKLNFGDFHDINTARNKGVGAFAACQKNWGPFDWAACANAEAGEMVNNCKKLKLIAEANILGVPHPYPDLDVDKLRLDTMKEIGDVGIYLDLLCGSMGVGLGYCIQLKFNETSGKNGWPFFWTA